MENEYLTVKETAARLGVTPATVYGAIREARLAAEKQYGVWVVAAAEVERYQQKTRSASGGHKPAGRPKGSKNRPKPVDK